MSHTPFSYAQAAKGQIAAQPAPQPTTSPAPPSVSSQGKDDATTTSSAATALTTSSGDHDFQDSAKQSKAEEEPSFSKQDPETSSRETTAASHPVAESASTTLVNGDSPSAETAHVANGEKRQRSPSRTSGSNDSEARKGRKGKKGRKDDKDADADNAQEEEKEPPKPVILSEAPIPSVNPWHKRRDTQTAKPKVTPATGSQSTTPAQSAAVDDSKKRGTTEEIDTPAGAQNGANGEKVQQRKSVDFSRSSDQIPRRNGPRGSRVPEKDEKSGAESLPPVADAALWPDVKSAVAAEEGKKKPQEKTERVEKEHQDETGPSKRSKKEWVAIPYVPTVNFQTQLPQRSSKPRGGARGGREAGSTRGAQSNTGTSTAPLASPTADKAQGTTSTAAAKEGRPREGSGPTRANSLPPSVAKRASIDASFARDARKPSAPATTDRSRDQASENVSAAASKGENSRAGRTDFSQAGSEQQSHFASRNLSDHRRAEAGFKGYDGFKEAGIPTAKDQSFAARDRSEGQSRGRGGYRARGGHNVSVAGHQQSGFQANGQYPVNSLPGRQSVPYSPPAHQGAFGSVYSGGSSRGAGRGNGRGSSGAPGYGRVNTNGAGPARMAPVNTGNMPYDYQMPQYAAYPPMQLPPVYDSAVIQLLTQQIEYYLSVDNLCKDVFLRKHMDSQGFVPFDLIAGFQRVKSLAPDLDHMRMACEVSDKMDYIVGEDGVDRLRLRDMWDRFVLPMEDRDEEGRTDGPAQFYMRSRHSRPAFANPMVPLGYQSLATSPTMFAGNFPTEEQMYQQPYMNGGHYDQAMNGADPNGHRYTPETQLSAAVPEFSPSVQTPFTLEGATTFSDEQVEGLMIMVEDKKESSAAGHTGAAVVNGTSSPSEHPQVNGVSHDTTSSAAESQSPSAVPKNIVWADGQKPTNPNTQGSGQRYIDLRKKALDERHVAKAGDTPGIMKTLYEFWSHFLVHSFNPKMYEEFRTCALEDAGKGVPARLGLKYLLQYYNELLYGDKQKPWGTDRPVPEIFNLHHQGALMADPTYGANGETRV